MKRKLLSILLIGVLFIGLTGCGNSSNKSSNKYTDAMNKIRNTKFEMLGEEYNVGNYIDYAIPNAKWSEDDNYVGDRGNGAVKVVGNDKNTGNEVEIVWIKNIENGIKRESSIDYIIINGVKEDDDAMAYSNYILYLENYKSDIEKQN